MPFFSLAFIEASVFQGLGRSWPDFWITFARVTLTYGLAVISIGSLSLGIGAVWGSLAVSGVVVSLVGLVWILLPCDK
jgi:O-antigen/teichoic acid export membrane protein